MLVKLLNVEKMRNATLPDTLVHANVKLDMLELLPVKRVVVFGKCHATNEMIVGMTNIATKEFVKVSKDSRSIRIKRILKIVKHRLSFRFVSPG